MTLKTSLVVVLFACGACGGSNLGGTGGEGGGGAGGTTGVAGTSGGGTTGTAGTSGGGTTGTAGTSGGGTTGVGATNGGGTGAAGGSANDEARVPRCLADLVAPCTCKSPGECGPQTCFKQGITVTTTTPDGGACNLTGAEDERRVFNADGSFCYSVRTTSYVGRACEDLTISWWDAAGNKVASASGYPSLSTLRCYTATPTITCTSTGETGVVSLNWPHGDCSTQCP